MALNQINYFRFMLGVLVIPLMSCATNQRPAQPANNSQAALTNNQTITSLESAQIRLEDAPLDISTVTNRIRKTAKTSGTRTPPPPAIIKESSSGSPGLDPQIATTLEAVKLYREFLDKFPGYDRRDQILYQLARCYEELGDIEGSMKIINQIVSEFPSSHYVDELQFRRGEYFFTRKRYLDAEEAYKAVVDRGTQSSYYEFALYKLGWTLYKQDLYQEALRHFFTLLDYKNKVGYDFARSHGSLEDQRMADILHVVSLTFSNLGGVNAIQEYFTSYGKPAYEAYIYSHLGEYYLDKRRYTDAAQSYRTFVKLYPYHKMSPQFDLRVNEIYRLGGFSQPVIETSKEFFASYGLKSEYWKHNSIQSNPGILVYVKDSLKTLANHFHALYQDKNLEKNKDGNFREAVKWYREFLASFPNEEESPVINYQLADLLFEYEWYGEAATEYEYIAYNYPEFSRAEAAGIAAIYALRQGLAGATAEEREKILRDIIDNSWQFADTFPQSKSAALMMEQATRDIYAMKEYDFAVAAGRKLLSSFPNAEPSIRSSALIIIGHALFDLAQYQPAEESYHAALQLMPDDSPDRPNITEFLAASIYKQGEQANLQADYQTAVGNFLRVGKIAPASTIRPAADYDGAAALMQLKQWEQAAQILRSFPTNYPGHSLQAEARKKLATLYKGTGRLSLAAAEYEQVEIEVQDTDMRRDALQLAAELYAQANNTAKAIQVYQRYIELFPKPLDTMLEKRAEIAALLKRRNDIAGQLAQLELIVAADAGAGAERTDRTRYLAAVAGLGLAEALFRQFYEIKLNQPFDQNLLRKSAAMKTARQAFENLLSYEVGEVTAAVTYYLAEMLYHFSQSLVTSERPAGLTPMEKEQYELSIEEQAYPFEERAIETHEKNLELLTLGVYNSWIDSSIIKLAKLVPARYDKFEQGTSYIESVDTFDYARLLDRKGVAIPLLPAAGSLK